MGLFSFKGDGKKTETQDKESLAGEDNYNKSMRCLYDREYEQAVKYMEMAAFLEHPDALNYMGRFLFDGVLCEKDVDRAVSCWKTGAKKENADSCYNLAVCYRDGTGVRKNMKKARSWAEKAVELGYKGEIDIPDDDGRQKGDIK